LTQTQNDTVSIIDVKNAFYAFYYFYKSAFLKFFLNVFYFLVTNFFILLNLLKSY